MQDWSMAGAHKFNFRYKKSDSSRNIVVCAHDDCPFRVSATYSSTRQCVVVASTGGEHNLHWRRPNWLRSFFAADLATAYPTDDPCRQQSTSPREIVDAVKLHHHVTITYNTTKNSKRLLLSDDLQQQGYQFQLPPADTDAVREADPEAHAQLSIEDREGTRRFQRLFICPGASREAFRHCRFFLAMDGTFTKDIFNLTTLMAASVDAANHAVLIAWAIVESENEDAWRVFPPSSMLTVVQEHGPPLSSSSGGREVQSGCSCGSH